MNKPTSALPPRHDKRPLLQSAYPAHGRNRSAEGCRRTALRPQHHRRCHQPQDRDTLDGVAVSGHIGTHNYREATLEAGGSTPSGEAQAGLFYTRASSDGFQDKGFDMQDLMVKVGMVLEDNQWLGTKFTYYENDANTVFI